MRKYILIIPFVLLALGCNEGGGGGDSRNFCYLLDSTDPCFDENAGGSTTIVTDQTVDEVIEEEEGMPGFEGELEIDDILNGSIIPFPGDTICPFEQSELVINTAKDWNRFRNSCVFGMEKIPDVDFSENMVFVTTRNIDGYNTLFETVLEFDNRLVAVIKDDVANMPTPAPGYRFDIVSIPKRDLPIDFIRVEVFFSPLQ